MHTRSEPVRVGADRRASAVLAVLAGGELGIVARAFDVDATQLAVDVGEFVAAGRAELDAGGEGGCAPPHQAVLAHELRTPVTIINGWTQYLREQVDDERQLRALEGIATQVARLQRLSEDALDAAAVVSGHLQLRLEPVDLHAVVRSVVDARGEDIAVPGAEDRTIVLADPDRLGQVLDNLLDNARRYAGEVPALIAVTREGGDVVVAVDTTGETLPAGVAEGLFQPYVRRSGIGGGSGLGLYICRQLVEAHGGAIGACPRPRGNRFWFRLPAQ